MTKALYKPCLDCGKKKVLVAKYRCDACYQKFRKEVRKTEEKNIRRKPVFP